jgi:hypothetical protein
MLTTVSASSIAFDRNISSRFCMDLDVVVFGAVYGGFMMMYENMT